jgi:hypothetical protein
MVDDSSDEPDEPDVPRLVIAAIGVSKVSVSVGLFRVPEPAGAASIALQNKAVPGRLVGGRDPRGVD